MVKVLVGKRQGPSFPDFWVEFEGEEVSSYEDTRGEQSIITRSTDVPPTMPRPTVYMSRTRATPRIPYTSCTRTTLIRTFRE